MSAVLDASRTYRYSLTRYVNALLGDGTVTFIGLNPSTADEAADDPTIRRCVRFARDWGFARLKMVNLYAYRGRHPHGLAAIEDPVGPDNDHTVAVVVGGSDLVVCAWGNWAGPFASERVEAVLALTAAPHALGLTKNGGPRHPLYVKADTVPVPFAHCPPQAAWTANSYSGPE